MIKLMTTIRITKEDSLPAEIIEGLFIGSVGASSNIDELKKQKITHVVCAASSLKPNFPNVMPIVKTCRISRIRLLISWIVPMFLLGIILLMWVSLLITLLNLEEEF